MGIMSKGRMKRILVMAMLSMLILSSFPAIASAAPSPIFEKGALTPKPPESSQPNNNVGLLSAYQLLFFMEGAIHDYGDGYVKIAGETITKEVVPQLGVSVRLERWTGTQWVSASNTYVFLEADDLYVYGLHYMSVAKGYYYRTVSTHTAKDGTISESHVIYTDYLLVPL